MKFLIIKPSERTTELVDAKDVKDVLPLARLKSGSMDHGVITRGIGIVVYEFGLFDPPAEQSYFAIGRQLFAGNAVVYQYNAQGETVSFDDTSLITSNLHWFHDLAQIEQAISNGRIQRPEMCMDHEPIWSWPDPAPVGMRKPENG